MIRWWEALSAPELAKWHLKYRVDWDAIDGRNGGGQQRVWEILLEMQRFKYRAGEGDLGAVTLVLDLAKAFERISLPVVWAWSTHFSALWVLRAPEAECSLKDVWWSRPGPSRLSCQGQSGVACCCVLCCRTR